MHTFFIAPTGFGVGLTSISLGLIRALQRAGLKVGFFKPIAQPHPGDAGPERSSELVARTHGLLPPQSLPLAQVERMLGDGQLDASVWLKNAFDKDYYLAAFASINGSYTASVGQPRTLGASVRYDF